MTGTPTGPITTVPALPGLIRAAVRHFNEYL